MDEILAIKPTTVFYLNDLRAAIVRTIDTLRVYFPTHNEVKGHQTCRCRRNPLQMLPVLFVFLLIAPFFQCFLLQSRLGPLKKRILFANPVNADGTKYRSGVTEEQAFEWFDEAVIFTRGGSGGAGCNSFRYGKARQHLGTRRFHVPCFHDVS